MGNRPLFVLIGSLVLSFGLALAGKYIFVGSILYVCLGLTMYIFGYRLCQMENLSELEIFSNRGFTESYVSEIQLFMGVLLCSYGFVSGAEVISSPSIFKMFLSGFSMVLGYMMAHSGFNGAVI